MKTALHPEATPKLGLDSFDDFVNEALTILEAAEKEGILVRLMGAVAVRIHCPKHAILYDSIDRPPTDIDLASYLKFKDRLPKFLQAKGYTTDVRLMNFPIFADANRQIYQGKTRLDVFFDELRMCHTVSWKNRLELDYPTISLADIVLEKLQIVKINAKDVKDLIMLFLEHDVAGAEQETINGRYVAEVLSNDWGFYYTATANLRKIVNLMDDYVTLKSDERNTILERTGKILDLIERKPKSLRWIMRSKVGTKKQWYADVGETQVPTKVE